MSEPVDLRVIEGHGTERPGLDLPETIDRDAWEAIGAGLVRESRERDIEWRIGDWAARADGAFATLADAAAIVGESAANLRKYVATAKAYPPVRRRTDLPFFMHLETCALPEADAESLLDAALAEDWTRAEMREAAREASAEGRLRRALRENARLKRELRQARADARDVADRARDRLDGERRVVRDSLRRIAKIAGELVADGALAGLHGNARRAVGRDLRKLGDALADNLEGALDELGAAADIIDGERE